MSCDDLLNEYEKYVAKRSLFILGTAVLLVGFILIGMLQGSSDISLRDVVSVILGQGEWKDSQIIWNIRLPRVLSSVLAGMGLAVAGAAMQSILRNPLGSPFTLGISQAAVFGVAFAVIVLGAGSTHSSMSDAVVINNPYIVTICAFLFGLICTVAILLVSRLRGATPETMILAGIIIGSLFTALTAAIEYFMAEDTEVASIVFWTFGNMDKASWKQFVILFVVVAFSLVYFIKNSLNYNALDCGDETAKSLGVHVERVRLKGLCVASLTTALAVSFFGVIAFVGLVVPHIVRRFIGGDERFLIPASALFGGLFLLVSDTLARTIIAPRVLPVGILTSFLGAPLFIYLILKGKERGYW